MALARRSGGRIESMIWPGFVDAMTALLLILMFVMSIFMIIQFTMSQKISGQSKELDDLTRQLAGLANVLSLERDRSSELESEVGVLQSNLTSQRSEADRLNAAMAALVQARDTAQARAAELDSSLADSVSERELLAAALASTRTEMDAAAETARLAAARREAMEALIAGLQAKDEGREAELATVSAERAGALALIEQLRAEQAGRDAELTANERELAKLEVERTAALALIAQLEADGEALAAVRAALEADKAALGAENLSLEDQRREVEALQAAALERLAALETRLTAEEEARLLEAAAAAALKRKLASSGTELDAMTLALEKARKEAEDTLILLAAAEVAKQSLEGEIADGSEVIDRELALRRLAESELATVQAQTLEEQKRVALLNAQTRELREQLGGLAALLDDAESRDAESQVQIARLGERLNAALARKVGQLARFQSVFFEKMEKVLGGRQDIQRVGDRFVFQSEVLFETGSAALGEAGQRQLGQLARTLTEIAVRIPQNLPWVLRVDGHTDRIPINTTEFPSNWELSTARAISVVRFLIDQGIAADHLAATGFGEHQPLDPGLSEAALRRNRRIELKLTQR
ncbi:MAG: peptidoglycan -binding protein [Proteobacteria bacterium]|nr:peptidoglycan -binding protein [Pseudomonadota bacterium]